MGPRNDQSAMNNDPKLPGKYWIVQGIGKHTGLSIQDGTTFSSEAEAIAEAEKRARLNPAAAFYILEAMEFITADTPIIRTQL